MWKSAVYGLCLLGFTGVFHGQAVPTASRLFQVQVGVAGSIYTLDDGSGHEEGITVYGDVDFSKHLGLEGLYRNASIETPHDIGENHLLAGPRFHLRHGRFEPYAKLLVGEGTINFQQGYNLTSYAEHYFIYVPGGGVDFHAARHVNVRLLDVEYQFWPGFAPHGLTPYGASAGLAYTF
jgi:hypothetical protein